MLRFIPEFQNPKQAFRFSKRPTAPSHRRGSRRGAAAIEMAFVAPFILFLIFGSAEFTRMLMVKQVLTHAAREGSRHAALATTQNIQASESVIRARLKSTIADYDDASVVRIAFSPDFSYRPASGTKITTTIEVDCADISWLPSSFLAGAKIRGSSSAQLE